MENKVQETLLKYLLLIQLIPDLHKHVLPMEITFIGESLKGLNVDVAIYLSSTSSLSLISSRTESCMLLISESVNVLSIDR